MIRSKIASQIDFTKLAIHPNINVKSFKVNVLCRNILLENGHSLTVLFTKVLVYISITIALTFLLNVGCIYLWNEKFSNSKLRVC